MQDPFEQADLQRLAGTHADVAVSIYMPATKVTIETQKDIIRLKNLVTQTQEQLMERGMRRPDALKLLQPALDLLEDHDFWRNQSHGLALFLTNESAEVFRLPFRFQEFFHIGRRFHIKPLLPYFNRNGRYYVLALSRNDVRFFEGNRYGLEQQTINNLPSDIVDALGEWESENQVQFHTRTGMASDGGRAAMFHGHAGSEVDIKDEILRFCRRIDDALQPLLREESAPLVLAAVDYLHPIYAEATSYSNLLDRGYTGNPDELSEQELHAATWEIVEPVFQARLQEDRERFAELAGTGRTSEQIDRVAEAAFHGRIDTVFLADAIHVWGEFNAETSEAAQHEEPDEQSEELLDFIALHTYLSSGTVHIVEREQMPNASVAAALYRY